MIKVHRHGLVHRIESSRVLPVWGSYWTVAYRVDDTLVDSGCAYTAIELAEVLNEKTINRIINTHAHEDHIGGNGLLQNQRDGLDILAHPLALPVLANPRETQSLHPYRKLFWGWPEPSTGKSITDGTVIETVKYTFLAIHTPGHSPDHICFYEPEQGWLFTGDLYVGGQDRSLREDGNIWEIIASLKKIAKLPATTLFPGSARIREKPAEALTEKINYLEDFGERVRTLYQKGWSVRAIVRELCGKPTRVDFITLGHFSRRHLVLSYINNHSGG